MWAITQGCDDIAYVTVGRGNITVAQETAEWKYLFFEELVVELLVAFALKLKIILMEVSCLKNFKLTQSYFWANKKLLIHFNL